MNKISTLFFVCDNCNHKEEPSFALKVKIEEDSADIAEFPLHCATSMRLTILEVDKKSKKIEIDVDKVKWSSVTMLKLYLQKIGRDETIVNDYQKEYFDLIEENLAKIDGNDTFAVAELMKMLIQPAIEKIHDLNIMKSELLPIIKMTTDTIINSAKNRRDGYKAESKKQDSFFTMSTDVEEIEISSVGIDCGSSTTHLIFSKLKLKRETGFLNMSRRFNVVRREIVYKGNIINTPLLDETTINIPEVVKFIKSEYEKAGFTFDDIDTGAVIVTGETAKKKNASKIVDLLKDEAGKFVSATAGPNFESLLAAMGSGARDRSMQWQNTILSVDIGGGTSNLAISCAGKVISTSCINVGGRLLGIDANRRIWRIDPPTKYIMEEIGIHYKIGDIISEEDLQNIARTYTEALIEVMSGPAKSKISKSLMMTDDLDFSIPIDEIIFCGGVSEMIYGEPGDYNDIGGLIAEILKNHNFGIPVIKPKSIIRATVIGAGSYSLSISGSTCYYDKRIELPLRNIPVLSIDGKLAGNKVDLDNAIKNAYQRLDLEEGQDIVALYFEDIPLVIPTEINNPNLSMLEYRDEGIKLFAKQVADNLVNSISKELPIIIIFQMDMAGNFGRMFVEHTNISKNYMFIDELNLAEGDFIDIGKPLGSNHSFPITIKSLAFY